MKFLNRSLRSRFDLLKPDPKDWVVEKQTKQARHHDHHSTTKKLTKCNGKTLRQGETGYQELLLN